MKKNSLDGPAAKQPGLVNHYGAIGPAAIVAALLHATRNKKPVPTSSSARFVDKD